MNINSGSAIRTLLLLPALFAGPLFMSTEAVQLARNYDPDTTLISLSTPTPGPTMAIVPDETPRRGIKRYEEILGSVLMGSEDSELKQKLCSRTTSFSEGLSSISGARPPKMNVTIGCEVKMGGESLSIEFSPDYQVLRIRERDGSVIEDRRSDGAIDGAHGANGERNYQAASTFLPAAGLEWRDGWQRRFDRRLIEIVEQHPELFGNGVNESGWTSVGFGQQCGDLKFLTNGTLLYKGTAIKDLRFDTGRIFVSPPDPTGMYAFGYTEEEINSEAFLIRLKDRSGKMLDLEGPPLIWVVWSPSGTHAVLGSYYEADLKLYSLNLATGKRNRFLFKLAGKFEEESLDTDRLSWLNPHAFVLRARINCNPYTDDRCKNDDRAKTLREYDVTASVVTMKVSSKQIRKK